MNARILYIEDEPDYQILVKRILSRAGLPVTMAESGVEGLRILERDRPSLLVLDVNLPDTDGFSICTRLRQDPAWARLPILMLTVKRRPDEWLQGFACGASDYLAKPLHPALLVDRVVNCLQGNVRHLAGVETAEYYLIQAAVNGNKTAFAVLIQKHRQRLFERLQSTIQNAAWAEDAVAHAFALAYENLAQFRGESSFYTWVYRIAVNELMSAHRRQTALSFDAPAPGSDSCLVDCTPEKSEPFEKTLADREIHKQARSALERVSEPYRKVLSLYCLEDLSYRAISQKLRIPQGTVMSRLHRARALFREAWGRQRSV